MIRKVGGSPGRPGGNKGMHCYDSIQKSNDLSSVYSTIQYHGRPLLQKECPSFRSETGRSGSSALKPNLEHLQASFLFRAMLSFFRILFLAILFPFHFLFSAIPSYIQEVVIPFCRLQIGRVVRPIVRGIEQIVSPVRRIIHTTWDRIEAQKQKARRWIAALRTQVQGYCAPVQRGISRSRDMIKGKCASVRDACRTQMTTRKQQCVVAIARIRSLCSAPQRVARSVRLSIAGYISAGKQGIQRYAGAGNRITGFASGSAHYLSGVLGSFAVAVRHVRAECREIVLKRLLRR